MQSGAAGGDHRALSELLLAPALDDDATASALMNIQLAAFCEVLHRITGTATRVNVNRPRLRFGAGRRIALTKPCDATLKLREGGATGASASAMQQPLSLKAVVLRETRGVEIRVPEEPVHLAHGETQKLHVVVVFACSRALRGVLQLTQTPVSEISHCWLLSV